MISLAKYKTCIVLLLSKGLKHFTMVNNIYNEKHRQINAFVK